jgi:energy-converting hydrogenase A subunit M
MFLHKKWILQRRVKERDLVVNLNLELEISKPQLGFFYIKRLKLDISSLNYVVIYLRFIG